MKRMTLVMKQIKTIAGVLMLVGSLLLVSSCHSDGKKESRTEDAMEKTGDAMAADAKDAGNKAEY
jgi:hypothetical protein